MQLVAQGDELIQNIATLLQNRENYIRADHAEQLNTAKEKISYLEQEIKRIRMTNRLKLDMKMNKKNLKPKEYYDKKLAYDVIWRTHTTRMMIRSKPDFD